MDGREKYSEQYNEEILKSFLATKKTSYIWTVVIRY